MGCNLIDTASNYGNGSSEELVGKVLEDSSLPEVFVVTKAGYISGDNLKILQNFGNHVKGGLEVSNIDGGLKHSIHPTYLDAQIKISQVKLRLPCIDGFLLHSPEYYFEQKDTETNQSEYYRRLAKAFEFLEEKVRQGIVRYYGVSSNTLATHDRNATDLSELIKIANRVSSNNHFKLIQFPFNLFESSAVQPSKGIKSVVDIARENGVRTFGNRPLNANSTSGLLRLVVHDMTNIEFSSDKDLAIHHLFFEIIEDRLKATNNHSSLSEFPIVQYLKDNWMTIPNHEVFQQLFSGTLHPFLNALYEKQIPKNVTDVFNTFLNVSLKYCLKNQTLRVKAYLESEGLEYLLPKPSTSLPYNLCKNYLRQGIDHVLVGMRNPRYVDELSGLFEP
jgi:aryl-alcohol dehydrogenase-like predicted oxidoreductase